MEATHQASPKFQNIWAPFVFCAILTLVKLFSSGGSGDPAYYAFLPMCFFGVATVHASILKRIKTLESMIDGRGSSTGA